MREFLSARMGRLLVFCPGACGDRQVWLAKRWNCKRLTSNEVLNAYVCFRLDSLQHVQRTRMVTRQQSHPSPEFPARRADHKSSAALVPFHALSVGPPHPSLVTSQFLWLHSDKPAIWAWLYLCLHMQTLVLIKMNQNVQSRHPQWVVSALFNTGAAMHADTEADCDGLSSVLFFFFFPFWGFTHLPAQRRCVQTLRKYSGSCQLLLKMFN